MADQQLVDYIKKVKSAGQTEVETRSILQKNGWTEAEINEALMAIGQPQQQPAQPMQELNPQPQAKPDLKPTYQAQASTVQNPSSFKNNPSLYKTPSNGAPNVFLIVGVALAVLVLLGGVAYFVAGQFFNVQLPFNFFAEKPESVLQKMLANSQNAKSYYSDTLVQANLTKDGNQMGSLSFNFKGQSDISEQNNPKANLDFSGNISFTLFEPEDPINITANANTVMIGEDFYFKLNSLSLPEEEAFGVNTSELKGIWIKMDKNTITTLNSLQGQESQLPSQMLNPDKTKELQNLFIAKDMFSVEKQLKDEVIKGNNAYHYLIKINKDKLKDAIYTTINLGLSAQEQDADGLEIGFAKEMTDTMIKGVLDKIGDLTAEVWVGKKDYMLYRFKFEKTFDLSEIVAEKTKLDVKIDNTFSDIGIKPEIQAPQDAKKLEDILEPALKNQEIGNPMREIKYIADDIGFFDGDYSALCKTGYLNGYDPDYGKILVDFHKDIVAKGSGKPACFANTTNYCVSTKLPDGTWMCMGKDKAYGQTQCVSAQTVCK